MNTFHLKGGGSNPPPYNKGVWALPGAFCNTKTKPAIKTKGDFIMNNRKYPTSLFVFGFLTNILFRFFWLFLPGIILLIVGIFVKPCLYVGLALLLIAVLLSLVEQFSLRQAFLEESDNPDFRAFQDALSKDGNWKDNIDELLSQKISDPQNEINSDDESKDK